MLEAGVVLLTIILSDSLEKFAFPGSVILSPGNTERVSLHFKLQLLPGHYVFLVPRYQQTKRKIFSLEGAINSDHQEEVGLLLHNGDKKEYVWHSGGQLEYFLAPPCPMSMANGQMQYLQKNTVTSSVDSPEVRILVTQLNNLLD